MPQKTPRVTYFTVLLYHLTGERAYRGSAGSPVGFLKLILFHGEDVARASTA